MFYLNDKKAAGSHPLNNGPEKKFNIKALTFAAVHTDGQIFVHLPESLIKSLGNVRGVLLARCFN